MSVSQLAVLDAVKINIQVSLLLSLLPAAHKLALSELIEWV